MNAKGDSGRRWVRRLSVLAALITTGGLGAGLALLVAPGAGSASIWPESGYNVVVDWWDGSDWVPQDSWLHTANVAAKDHFIQVEYDKPAGRPAGLYRMCGDTFSEEHGSQHPFCAPAQNLTSDVSDALDVLGYIPVFNSFDPTPPYDARWDLDASGGITLGDVLSYIPVFNLLCTP